MKPEIEYLVVADRVILEQESGKASIIGIFQVVNVPKETSSIAIPLTVFVRIKGIDGSVKGKVYILDPDGVEAQSISLEGKADKRLQVKAVFSLVNFDKEGKYKVRVHINGNDLDSKEEHSIEVIKQK